MYTQIKLIGSIFFLGRRGSNFLGSFSAKREISMKYFYGENSLLN
jgi:hypothetical protein